MKKTKSSRLLAMDYKIQLQTLLITYNAVLSSLPRQLNNH